PISTFGNAILNVQTPISNFGNAALNVHCPIPDFRNGILNKKTLSFCAKRRIFSQNCYHPNRFLFAALIRMTYSVLWTEINQSKIPHPKSEILTYSHTHLLNYFFTAKSAKEEQSYAKEVFKKNLKSHF
ncbi:MAG: hypothetical protein AAB071_05200, partial [Bacteroidota bacterium]